MLRICVWMIKLFQKLLGYYFLVFVVFDVLFCIDEYIVFFNFLFDSNFLFFYRYYYERIENAYMNLFIIFFF